MQRIRISNIPQEYVVDSLENFSSILIRPVNDLSLSRLLLINGNWQVEGYNVPHTVIFRNLNDPSQIQVGDVGNYIHGGQYARKYWDGFTVTQIILPGRKIQVQFDRPLLIGKEQPTTNSALGSVGWIPTIPEENKNRVLEYRRPGKWMFQGITAKATFGHIQMGEKKIRAKEGIF